MANLEGKVALVTGGASGLGRAIAERFVAEGARVVVADIQVELGHEASSKLGSEFVALDVTDEAAWHETVAGIQASHGGLHVLVNNAGVLGAPGGNDFDTTTVADWRRIFAVNVEGVFLGCRAAIPAIHGSGGGSIVNVSSVAAHLATPFTVAYGASKAACRHITKSVAQYCVEQRYQIRCNSVHPGIVRTPALDHGYAERSRMYGIPADDLVARDQQAIPMAELTLPEDVAGAVVFLASDDSRHITGDQVTVDGGMTYCDTYFNANLRQRSSRAHEDAGSA